jgi:hypothetical protein
MRGVPNVDPACPYVVEREKNFLKEHSGLTTLREKTSFWREMMRKHAKECSRCRVYAAEAGVDFRKGMPSVAEIEEHTKEHPFIDDRGHLMGAIWMVIDEEGNFGPYPQHCRLRMARPDEEIIVNEETPAGAMKPTRVKVPGKILLANGWSFWQLLEKCHWAERSVYVPCTARGVPLRWKEDR